MIEILDSAQKEVALGKVDKAIELIHKFCLSNNSSKTNFNIRTITLISSRYQNFRAENRIGILNSEYKRIELAQISKSILDFIFHLREEYFKKQNIELISQSEDISEILETGTINSSNVKVALAGYSNVGKSTLLRNIIRAEVGIVCDKSNATKDFTPIDKEEIGIRFIDCPGFNEAGRILDLLDDTPYGEEFEEKLLKKNLREDLNAIKGIRLGDIIIYVVSVMRVPNRGDISAIELVKKFNDKIIAVINMVHTLGEVNKEQSLHRINLWNETFSKCGIRTRINYDFYWDSPLKLIKLYKSIYEFISNDSKEAFALKISKIEKKYARDCQEISSAIHTTIINCQKINYEIVIDDSKDEQMKKNKMNNALEKIQNEIVYYLQPVLQKIEEVYQIQGNNSYDNDDVNAESKILQSSFSKKTEQVTGGVMVGGAFGVYGVLKAIALGSAFASAAPIILGSAIIGGIWALFSKGENATELINVHLDNNQLTNILKRTIGILRVSSNQGFGKNSKLDEEVLESIIENKIDDLFNKYEIESIRDVSHEKLNKQINSIVFDICEM